MHLTIKVNIIILFSIAKNVIYCDEDYLNPTPVFIDNLITEYLVAEQKLWENIKSNYRNNTIVLSIRKVHEPFLDRIYPHNIIWDKIVKIQSLDNLVPFWHLHHLNNSIYLDKLVRNVVENGSKNISLDFYQKCAEIVYNVSMNETFWTNIDKFVDNDTSRACINFESIESKHHLIYDAYVNIKAVLFKAYINEQLHLMFLNCRTLYPNYHRNATQLRHEFQHRNLAFEKNIKARLKAASRYITGCDPSMNIGIPNQYVEITNFWQGHIINEVNLNADNTCKNKCTDYKITKEYCNVNTTENFEENFRKTCVSYLRDCVEFTDENLKFTQPFMKKSWHRWFYKCNNCLCLCDDFNSITESDRYFSLRDVVSNIAENRVVTGVMIIKLNGLIQFAIAEKQLLPYCEIEKPSKVKFIFNYKRDAIYDKSVFNQNDVRHFRKNIDYYALNYLNRSINLDTILAPRNKLVTGVRFQLHHGHLQLQIRVTEFDFRSGRLVNLAESKWLSNENGGKNEINIKHARNPYSTLQSQTKDVFTMTNERYVENSLSNSFVQFQSSDPYTDFARVTFPFIESYPIIPYNEVPLAGLGIYYKGRANDGGLIALKTAVYDFASHILPDFN